VEERKKRSFRKYSFRGVDLERLLELNLDALLDLFHARARRKCASATVAVFQAPQAACAGLVWRATPSLRCHACMLTNSSFAGF
jgi:transposase